MLNVISYNKIIVYNLYKKMKSVVIKVNILWYLEELILGGNLLTSLKKYRAAVGGGGT